jgi:immune inhibitor A
VSRRIIGVLGGITSAALIATALQAPAAAAPPADLDNPQDPQSASSRPDDRPDMLEQERRANREAAKKLVISGDRKVQNRSGSRSVKIKPKKWVEYEVESSDRLLSFLVEFGGEGPRHNEIPKPESPDNSTYWKPDFDRQHYLDMFFNGMQEQGGESFKSVYKEMSSGRYDVSGDVGDWVQVDKPQSAYGTTESHQDMTFFIDDTAEAWYDSQIAAGKSKTAIEEYLQSFDEWDRFDYDGDGDFDEPDGYIDHFQAIHAGEGEEAGAPESAIWSHRWAVNQDGFHPDGTGPKDFGKFGGIKIGDTNLWIRDYTTEPENGGLGVFVHEYGHDLGLPDLYDTQGGENGTGYWTLMSSGSWLGHGDGAIGTTPNHMGPWEKLQLGWLDYVEVEEGQSKTVDLGPSFHATTDPQAVIVNLPDHTVVNELGEAAEGQDYFYSGRGDDRDATVTSPEFTVPAAGQLTAQVNYAIETDWDYAFVEISSDGQNWDQIPTNLSTESDPNGQNDGHGITGTTEGKWVNLTANLSDYADQDVQLRFRMFNDAAVNELGFKVDAISVGSALSESAEDGAPGWSLDGFVIAENGATTEDFAHYYIAENRTYGGYDSTLSTGPYNFGWSQSAPNKVEHFPYQDGLLVWYWNTQYSDNNTSAHPGGGEILPVDADADAMTWSDGTIARNRIQAFDATFGKKKSDSITLHRETEEGMTYLRAKRSKDERVFDDTDPMAYYDQDNPGGSVIVGGTGTQIRVAKSNRHGLRVSVR